MPGRRKTWFEQLTQRHFDEVRSEVTERLRDADVVSSSDKPAELHRELLKAAEILDLLRPARSVEVRSGGLSAFIRSKPWPYYEPGARIVVRGVSGLGEPSPESEQAVPRHQLGQAADKT